MFQRGIADGLDEEIHGVDRVTAHGEVDHLRHEDEDHVRIQLADALRGAHAVHAAHLYVEQDDVVVGGVAFEDLVAIAEDAGAERFAVLARVALHSGKEFPLVPGVVFHDRNVQHERSPFCVAVKPS